MVSHAAIPEIAEQSSINFCYLVYAHKEMRKKQPDLGRSLHAKKHGDETGYEPTINIDARSVCVTYMTILF